MLYVRGDAQILNQPCIGVVGTRRPTLYGTQMAERLGRELAARGLIRDAAGRCGGGRRAVQRLADYRAPGHGVWARSVAVPGNVTQPVSFAPNQLIKQGAKLVTNGEDVIEELPTPIRAVLVRAEAPEAEQRNLLAAASLNSSEKKIYDLLSVDDPKPIDDIVERSELNSSEVLATLFDLEMKGIVRQLPGKQFSRALL